MMRRRFPARPARRSPTASLDMRLKMSPKAVSESCPPASGCPPVTVDPADGTDPVTVQPGDSYVCPGPSYWHEDGPYWVHASKGCNQQILNESDFSNRVTQVYITDYEPAYATCMLGGHFDPASQILWEVNVHYGGADYPVTLLSGEYHDFLSGHDFSFVVAAFGPTLTAFSPFCAAPLPFDFVATISVFLNGSVIGTCGLSV